jgi:hypothetical protein
MNAVKPPKKCEILLDQSTTVTGSPPNIVKKNPKLHKPQKTTYTQNIRCNRDTRSFRRIKAPSRIKLLAESNVMKRNQFSAMSS